MIALLPAAAAGDGAYDTVFSLHLDYPEGFEDAEYVEFEDYIDAAGHYDGFIQEGGAYYRYVYLKQESDTPHLTVPFEVDRAGTYDFLLELMAYETHIPARDSFRSMTEISTISAPSMVPAISSPSIIPAFRLN